jgi:PIN like domain
MKSILPEWYEPDDETVERVLKTGTIALDTNVLLRLYRVGRQQREEILSVLRDNRDRIFVPYQVALEYQRNRLDVLADIEATYRKILERLDPKYPPFQDIRDPDLRKEVEQLFTRTQKSFAKGLAKIREEHTISFDEARKEDPVRDALDELLTQNSLGQQPAEEELVKRRSEAQRRAKAEIPPGFGDADKPDSTGDYLVWAELLDHAKDSDRPLLFVTDDEIKGDWYRRVRGQTTGPRAELVAEVHTVTSHPYHQRRLGSFLELAREYLGASVEDQTIALVGIPPPEPQFGSFTVRLHPRIGSPTLNPTMISFLEQLEVLSANGEFLQYLEKNPDALTTMTGGLVNQLSDIPRVLSYQSPTSGPPGGHSHRSFSSRRPPATR